jgi:hypothetical protein
MKPQQLGAGLAALFGTTALLALTACDGGSATAARDHSSGPGAAAPSSYANAGGGYSSNSYSDSGSRADRGGSSYGSDRDDPRREPVKLVNGKPIWAANRRHSAEENAEYQFNRDGADFGGIM